MENVTLFFTLFLVSIWLLQTLIMSNKNEYLILTLVLAVIGAYGFTRFKEMDGIQHSTKTFVNELAGVSTKQKMVIGDLDLSHHPAVYTLMSSDTTLQGSLKRFEKYKDLNVQLYEDVVGSLFKFYELYAKCLLQEKDVAHLIVNLIDQRRAIINNATSLYMQVDHATYASDIYKIVLGLQASTYKCLNVLKNKFGVHAYVSPVAQNLTGDKYQLF
jgi:hypothetical protein